MKKKVINPLGNRVLVELDPAQQFVGIFEIPEQARDKEVQFGTVLAVGPKAPDILQRGSRVFVSKWGGTPIESGNDFLKLFDSDEVWAELSGTENCAGCKAETPVEKLRTMPNGKRVCAECVI